MAKKGNKHKDYYVIIEANKPPVIRKYLSKVEHHTGIKSTTLSKHFNTQGFLYQKGIWQVYKTQNVDLKSYNKGNSYNLSSSEY